MKYEESVVTRRHDSLFRQLSARFIRKGKTSGSIVVCGNRITPSLRFTQRQGDVVTKIVFRIGDKDLLL